MSIKTRHDCHRITIPQTHPTTYNRLKKRSNMKVAILVMAFVALTASVAYTAPTENEDAEIEAFVNKLMEQEEASEQDDHAAQMESFLAQLQDEDDDGEEAALQEFFAREQILAKVQGWRRIARSVARGVKKYGPTALKYGVKYGPSVVRALGRR
ncbi:uncharacterized protein LOC135337519 [Halichondria panicea]|uniref:uncharacterized protein LOC135337519 n=1 Tax=Halichondria panicea TaxID=6063 RepID=UPI00312BB2D3